MTDNGKRLILLGYALAYAAGVSAYTAISTEFAISNFLQRSVSTASIPLIAGLHMAMTSGYALGFVILAAVLDVLTKRRPQPLNAFSVGLAALTTLSLLQQMFFVSAYTNYAVVKPW